MQLNKEEQIVYVKNRSKVILVFFSFNFTYISMFSPILSGFFEKGSFEKRFGVKKNFYDFMKKHDISYEELYVLKLIQRPNIEIIRSLLRISFSNLNDLEKANNYISLVKLAEYSKTKIIFLFNFI